MKTMRIKNVSLVDICNLKIVYCAIGSTKCTCPNVVIVKPTSNTVLECSIHFRSNTLWKGMI